MLDVEVNDINPVSHPSNFTDSDADNINMAYSVFMRALSSQIVGSMSFLQDVNTSAKNNSTIGDDIDANRTYSDISTSLASTSLLGSSNLNNFFIKNHALGSTDPPPELFSPPRLYDMAVARNRTLDVLIEELAFNTTISLMMNPRFAPPAPTNITVNQPYLIYLYSPRNLLLTYGIALPVSLLAVILGLVAFAVNGVSHNNSFSSILGTTGGLHDDISMHLNPREQSGALPLDKEVAKRKIAFSAPRRKARLRGRVRSEKLRAEKGRGIRKGSQSGRLGFGFA